jgi:hypothetical protein
MHAHCMLCACRAAASICRQRAQASVEPMLE